MCEGQIGIFYIPRQCSRTLFLKTSSCLFFFCLSKKRTKKKTAGNDDGPFPALCLDQHLYIVLKRIRNTIEQPHHSLSKIGKMNFTPPVSNEWCIVKKHDIFYHRYPSILSLINKTLLKSCSKGDLRTLLTFAY